jgi:hypothetical protein
MWLYINLVHIYMSLLYAVLFSLQRGDGLNEETFELNAYEAVLTTVKQIITDDCNICSRKVNKMTTILKSGSLLPIEVQENMRSIKNLLATLLVKCSTYIRFLTDLLENDESMALMNLSKLKKCPYLYK